MAAFRRGKLVLISSLVAALLLPGCAGAKDKSSVPVDEVGSPGGIAVEDEEAGVGEGTAVTRRAVEEGAEPGLARLSGRIHDNYNFSIQDARIDLLGTAASTRSGADGTYSLTDLEPGPAKVRIEAGGFFVRQLEITLRADEEAILDVTLESKIGGGFIPHVHDFWSGPERVLMDGDVPVPDELHWDFGNVGTPVNERYMGRAWPISFGESLDGKPSTIWPGTAALVFTVSWPTSPEQELTSVALSIRHAAMDAGKAAIVVGSVANGGSVTYTLAAANETDHGHALASEWVVSLAVPAASSAGKPVLLADHVRVKIVQQRGSVVFDPPHRDHWQGNQSSVVGNPDWQYRTGTAYPVEADSNTKYGVFTLRPSQGGLNIIPPGTQHLQVNFSWVYSQGEALGFDYSLTYRTADQDLLAPASAFKQPPAPVASGTRWKLYDIPVNATQVDGFYQDYSLWGFKWNEDNGLTEDYYLLSNFVTFRLGVTAFKDPDW